MKNRLAVIDLGTNTFHLLIVDTLGGEFTEVYRHREFIYLAEEGIATIGEAALSRAYLCLSVFRERLNEYDVAQVRVTGTAALRTAQNGTAFVAKVQENYGLHIEIIDGKKEAILISKGTALALRDSVSDYLIMDIGGGSVEFIVVDNGEVGFAESYPIGVSVSYQLFDPKDPIQKDEIMDIEKYISHTIDHVKRFLKDKNVKTLVGASGSFEVLQCMLGRGDDLREVSNFDISAFDSWYALIIKSTLDERYKMPNLPPERAKLIVVAAIMMKTVLRECHLDQIAVSPYALKEGLLSEMMTNLD